MGARNEPTWPDSRDDFDSSDRLLILGLRGSPVTVTLTRSLWPATSAVTMNLPGTPETKVPGEVIVSGWFFSSWSASHFTSTPPTGLLSWSKATALKMTCSPVLSSTSPGQILTRAIFRSLSCCVSIAGGAGRLFLGAPLPSQPLGRACAPILGRYSLRSRSYLAAHPLECHQRCVSCP